MKLAASGTSILHGFQQHGMLEEFTVLDHQLDASRVHVDNASGTNVQMADLAIAHLVIWKPDVLAAGVDERVGILAQQAVVIRLAGKGNGIGFAFRAVSPAVKDDKNKWFGAGQ